MKIPGARKFIMLKIDSYVLPIAAHRFRSIFFALDMNKLIILKINYIRYVNQWF